MTTPERDLHVSEMTNGCRHDLTTEMNRNWSLLMTRMEMMTCHRRTTVCNRRTGRTENSAVETPMLTAGPVRLIF
ncbi:hypothetical protein HanPI659440_Chr02g0084711 [Helianthus annuus]|nr:hypothetical protein HanPI659440_Chr02g0084711 [Helianthus annuus]